VQAFRGFESHPIRAFSTKEKMIELKGVSLNRGAKTLLNQAHLSIHPGEKVGLIGANGSGKSTLLSLLRKELKEDAGDVIVSKQWRISSVAQELEQSDTTAIDFVLSGDEEWASIQNQLTVAEQEGRTSEIVALHDRLATIDGYSAPARAAELLHGLGFSALQQNWATQSFSGGWQMRLNLARALMKPCELMLLDEPTNHLDLDAIVWLERWLQRFSGTLIIISHDSVFLDNVVQKIVWLNQKKFESHKGNYSDFMVWRAEKIQSHQKMVEKQEQKRDHLQSFVDRFRAKASKAKQAQSRLKMLEKMDVLSKIPNQTRFEFRMPAAENCPNPVAHFKDGFLGYTDKAILRNLTLQIGPKDRIGLLGANGAGKSTLIKTLSGQLQMVSGQYTRSPKLKIGYFAQHQLDLLEPEQTAYWHLERESPGTSPTVLRSFLGQFGFAGDMAFGRIGVLSGGEKARLVLALLAWQKPHLLLLDEPTNHLDLETREALALALQEFEGAVIVVSHDRQLLGSVVDQFWLVSDGTISPYDQDLESYADWLLKERKKECGKESSGPTPPKNTPKESKEKTSKILKIEKKISELQKKIDALNLALSDPVLYEQINSAAWGKQQSEKDALEKQLLEYENEWYSLLQSP
jgi:ATP-binding cassette subfamily F protein 3